MFFCISIHDYTLCITGSSYYNVNYYNYVSRWPYYRVIHSTACMAWEMWDLCGWHAWHGKCEICLGGCLLRRTVHPRWLTDISSTPLSASLGRVQIVHGNKYSSHIELFCQTNSQLPTQAQYYFMKSQRHVLNAVTFSLQRLTSIIQVWLCKSTQDAYMQQNKKYAVIPPSHSGVISY